MRASGAQQFQKVPSTVTVSGTVSSASDVQPSNGPHKICVTPAGILTDVSAEQPLNSPLCKSVRSSGRTAFVRFLQFLKILLPFSFTPAGTVISVRC